MVQTRVVSARPVSLVQWLAAQMSPGGAATVFPSSRRDAILLLSGINLLLLQFMMVRELTAILRGSEVIILLVTVAYLAGYSVGYRVSDRVTETALRRLALGVWALHWTLPFSLRYLSGWIASLGYPGMMFLFLLFMAACLLSSFYSLLLPRFIDADRSESALVRCYGMELVGATTGVSVLIIGIPYGLPFMILYQLLLCTMTVVLLGWSRGIAGAAVLATVVGYAAVARTLEARSAAFVYDTLHRFEQSAVLYSADSLYQKVEIVRDKHGQRYLYLDGRLNYGSLDLKRFNVFLSELPALLQRPTRALIVGSGSMSSVARVSPLAKHVTTVELDDAVVAGSRLYFGDVNRLESITNWTLTIDDAKHFLGSTDQRFDLVVMDVPAPLTIQLALLHSAEFYQLVRSRLAPGGVISVSLSGKFKAGRTTPLAVAATLAKVFGQMYVYTVGSANRSFVIAGDDLRFSRADLELAIRVLGELRFQVFDRSEALAVIGEAEPIQVDHLGMVLTRSWSSTADTYLPGWAQ